MNMEKVIAGLGLTSNQEKRWSEIWLGFFEANKSADGRSCMLTLAEMCMNTHRQLRKEDPSVGDLDLRPMLVHALDEIHRLCYPCLHGYNDEHLIRIRRSNMLAPDVLVPHVEVGASKFPRFLKHVPSCIGCAQLAAVEAKKIGFPDALVLAYPALRPGM